MNRQRQDRIKSLFLEAVKLDEQGRHELLGEACSEDPSLRDEVESLLAHHDPHTIIDQRSFEETLEFRSGATRTTARTVSKRRARRFWMRPFILGTTGKLALGAAAVTLIIAALGLWVFGRTHRELERLWGERLDLLVKAEVAALEQWLENEKSTVESWARHPELDDHVKQLLELNARGEEAATVLDDAPEQQQIREMFTAFAGDRAQYVIWDRAGIAISESESAKFGVGRMADSANAAVLAEVFRGKPLLRLPFHRQHVSGSEGTDPQQVVMAVLVPIFDESNAVVAALAVGGPSMWEELNDILTSARAGDSGETYAFNRQGLMISESRYADQLRRAGLLPDDSAARTSLQIELRDPEVDLTRGGQSRGPRSGLPLIEAVAHAVEGRGDVNLDGYRDYRGVWVVGAWQWLPEYEFGIVTQVNYAEAAAAEANFNVAFGLLFGVLALSVATVVVSAYRIDRLRHQIGEARRLGQYTLEEKIGEGGMGEVYRARHALLKRPTAIKLLKPDLMTPETIARFEREVQLASQLAHPNTIEIYDYGKTPEGVLYYAMEFLRGLTLGQLVAIEGQVCTTRAVYLLLQVCGSLREAHTSGLVHRDVTPNNIMLCRRGGMADVVKVLDFGLAKPLDAPGKRGITVEGALMGTPLYIAPERLIDPQSADPRSDLYSLGSVMFKMLSGRNVFDGDSYLEVFQKTINAPPPRLSEAAANAPAAIEELVAKCLAKMPDDRPSSAQQIIDVLEELAVEFPWRQGEAFAWWDRYEPREKQMASSR